MRLLLGVSAAFVISAVAVTGAPAKTVRGGTVEVGRGAAGIYLGMTRQEVVDMLGRPREKGRFFLSYGPAGADTSFDVYVDGTKRRAVRMIGLWGREFVLPDGTRLFTRGALRRLKKVYGDRLRRVHYRRTDTRLHRLKTRYLGERVWTDFLVDRFRPNAKIRTIFILFPDR